MGALLKEAVLSGAFILFIMPLCLAQSGGFGVWEDSVAYNALPLMPRFEDGQKGEGALPQSVSLRAYCPRPLNQGATSACAGFAVAHAMTVLSALQAGSTDPEKIRQMSCSPWYIYNQIKQRSGDCSSPSKMEDAIRILKEQGVCLRSEFSPAVGDCDATPSATARASAAKRRLKDAAALFEWKPEPERKIAAVRSALAGGMPVVANVQVYQSFRNLAPGVKYWNRKNQTDNYLDKHFLLITGYDELTQAFEVMSSWGTDWADDGFAYLNYTDFAAICLMAYQFLPYDFTPQNLQAPLAATILPNAENAKAAARTDAAAGLQNVHIPVRPVQSDAMLYLQGCFEFLQPVWNESTQRFDLEPEAVVYDPIQHLYNTRQYSFPRGTPFMLRSSAIPAGKYVYVFSCDPKGKVQMHWPKDQRQAQFMPGKHAVITIPSTESALELTLAGDDFLCILYSDDALPDIQEQLSRIRGYSADNFYTVLNAAFPGLLIAPDKLRCDAERMWVRGSVARKEGRAMVVVLRVRGE